MRCGGSIFSFLGWVSFISYLIVMVRSILDLCLLGGNGPDEIDGWRYTLVIVNYGAHTHYEGVYLPSSVHIFFYLTGGRPTLPQPGVGVRDVHHGRATLCRRSSPNSVIAKPSGAETDGTTWPTTTRLAPHS